MRLCMCTRCLPDSCVNLPLASDLRQLQGHSCRSWGIRLVWLLRLLGTAPQNPEALDPLEELACPHEVIAQNQQGEEDECNSRSGDARQHEYRSRTEQQESADDSEPFAHLIDQAQRHGDRLDCLCHFDYLQLNDRSDVGAAVKPRELQKVDFR